MTAPHPEAALSAREAEKIADPRDRYYGENGAVWKAPVETRKENGTTSISIGFKVCTMTDVVGPEAADTVADLMNAGVAALAQAPAVQAPAGEGLTGFAEYTPITIGTSTTPTDAQPKAAPVGDEALREALKKAVTDALYKNQFEDDWRELVDPVVNAALTAVLAPRSAEAKEAVAIPTGEERDFWLEAAEQHGFTWNGDNAAVGSEDALLKLMAAAREQGRQDMRASHPTTGQETVAAPRDRDSGVREALGAPHCYVVPGQDTANDYGAIDANCCEEGELTRPLWTFEDIVRAFAALSVPGSAGPGETLADKPEVWLVTHHYHDRPSTTTLLPYEPEKAVAPFRWDITPLYRKATPSPAQEPGTGDTGASHQRDMALEALHTLGVRLGVLDPAIACDGPQLLAAMSFYSDSLPTPATTAETRGPAEGAR